MFRGGGTASQVHRRVYSLPQQLSSCFLSLLFTPTSASSSRSPCCCQSLAFWGPCTAIVFVLSFFHSRFRIRFPAPAKMPPVHLLSNLQDVVLVSCYIHPALVNLSFILNIFSLVFTRFQKRAKLDKCVQCVISSREIYCALFLLHCKYFSNCEKYII